MRVIGSPGKTTPESSSCDEDDCGWEYEGDRALTEARAHTKETGHVTVTWLVASRWFRRGVTE